MSAAGVLEFFAVCRAPFWGIFQQPDIVEIQTGADGVVYQKPLSGQTKDSGIRITEQQAEAFVRVCAHLGSSLINPGREQTFNGVISDGREKFRVSCSVPPVSDAVSFTVRRFLRREITLQMLEADDVLSKQQGAQIRDAVKNKENIIVAGATGAGKTTLMNAMLHEAKKYASRFVVIEENAREVDLGEGYNVSYYQNTPATDIDQLVKNALRMSPERIIFGEIRDSAAARAFYMALTTGHPGSMSTLHAADARSAFRRMAELLKPVGIDEGGIADHIQTVVHIGEDLARRSGRAVSEIVSISRAKNGGIVLHPRENRNHEQHNNPF